MRPKDIYCLLPSVTVVTDCWTILFGSKYMDPWFLYMMRMCVLLTEFCVFIFWALHQQNECSVCLFGLILRIAFALHVIW